jgi:hypothetical protein
MAWLNATPEGHNKSRYAQFFDGLGVSPDVPETEGYEHLVDYLFRFGPGLANGMGYVSCSFSEIQAWSQLVRIPLNGWEAETLHKMSQAYCGQLSISSKRDCVAPWSKIGERTTQQDREKIAKGTLGAFERAAKKPAKKRRR